MTQSKWAKGTRVRVRPSGELYSSSLYAPFVGREAKILYVRDDVYPLVAEFDRGEVAAFVPEELEVIA